MCSSLAGSQITSDKDEQSVFSALISAPLQHISLVLSTGIISLSLENATPNAQATSSIYCDSHHIAPMFCQVKMWYESLEL